MREITDINELKSIELEVMKKIHGFCVENGIVYYLAYGTLIGAMRHGGFIPWDDDIDIWMPRPDYQKFLSIFPAWAHENGLELANHKTDVYFGRAMSKVFDSRTKLIEPEFRFDDPIGVFVDVWPLDGTPNDTHERDKHIAKAIRYHKMLYACVTKPAFATPKKIIKSLTTLPFTFVNSKQLIDKIEELAQEYTYSNAEWVYCPAYPMVVMEKESFKDAQLAKFEDTEFYVPSGYDALLTKRYGAWREYPPAKDRVPHHVINTWWLE